jgi:hypothetical protein
MAMAINSTARAMENMEYVRSLLKQRQPEFAAALERAAMLAEKTPQSQRRRLVLRQVTLILSSAQVPVTESGARSHLGGASGSLDDLPVFGGRGGGSASSDDAEGEQCGTAALHEVSDLMPVEAVGVDLGQRLGDPESLEL